MTTSVCPWAALRGRSCRRRAEAHTNGSKRRRRGRISYCRGERQIDIVLQAKMGMSSIFETRFRSEIAVALRQVSELDAKVPECYACFEAVAADGGVGSTSMRPQREISLDADATDDVELFEIKRSRSEWATSSRSRKIMWTWVTSDSRLWSSSCTLSASKHSPPRTPTPAMSNASHSARSKCRIPSRSSAVTPFILDGTQRRKAHVRIALAQRCQCLFKADRSRLGLRITMPIGLCEPDRTVAPSSSMAVQNMIVAPPNAQVRVLLCSIDADSNRAGTNTYFESPMRHGDRVLELAGADSHASDFEAGCLLDRRGRLCHRGRVTSKTQACETASKELEHRVIAAANAEASQEET